MPTRMYPTEYFIEEMEQPKKLQTEPSVIPIWVPILIGISLIAMAIITIYALSLTKKERSVYKERHG